MAQAPKPYQSLPPARNMLEHDTIIRAPRQRSNNPSIIVGRYFSYAHQAEIVTVKPRDADRYSPPLNENSGQNKCDCYKAGNADRYPPRLNQNSGQNRCDRCKAYVHRNLPRPRPRSGYNTSALRATPVQMPREHLNFPAQEEPIARTPKAPVAALVERQRFGNKELVEENCEQPAPGGIRPTEIKNTTLEEPRRIKIRTR